MKNFTLIFTILFLMSEVVQSASFTVKNSGNTFTPASITISAGDEVVFQITSTHNAVEVSKSVWDANGTTSNKGFNVPYGGGKVTFTTAGTYYYVCQPHAGMGMKGSVVVTAVTGIEAPNSAVAQKPISVYPNPAGRSFSVRFFTESNQVAKIDIVDYTGKLIRNLVTAKYSPGSYTSNYSTEGVSPGVYFIRFTNGEHGGATPLIVSHLN